MKKAEDLIDVGSELGDKIKTLVENEMLSYIREYVNVKLDENNAGRLQVVIGEEPELVDGMRWLHDLDGLTEDLIHEHAEELITTTKLLNWQLKFESCAEKLNQWLIDCGEIKSAKRAKKS
jgi:hypothetical protein